MSYDLYFTSPPVTKEEFAAYFEERKNYEQAEENEAFYSNEETGVYFSFHHNEEPPEEDGIGHSVMFNINFYRPHYFILEAEPEVTAFVRHFDCSINDPQMSGMGDSLYSPAGLLQGWNQGNEFGYKAVLSNNPQPDVLHTRPTRELESIWQWNFRKEARFERIQKDIFIPRIMFAIFDGQLRSVCVWPDAICTLIPRVDLLIVPRENLAPWSLFGGRKPDLCIVDFEEALPAIEKYRVDDYEITAYELPCPEVPNPIKGFVKKLKPSTIKPQIIPTNSVLNSELVEKQKTA